MMRKQTYKILIVDDSAEDRVTFRYFLQKDDEFEYKFLEAELGEAGIEICLAEQPDCVLLDYNLPDCNGLAVLKAINPDPLDPVFPVILLTGEGDESLAVKAMKQGAQDYLVKGEFSYRELYRAVHSAMEIVSLRRKQEISENELRESQEHLGAIFRQTAVGICQTDMRGRYVLVNNKFCELVGRTREELLTLRFQDITHPEDLEPNLEMIGKMREGLPSFVIEKRYIRPDDSIAWASSSVSFIYNADGKPMFGVGVMQDITTRKRAEKVLRESEEHLRLATEAAEMYSWEIDLSDQTIKFADNQAQVLGFALPENYTEAMAFVLPADRADADRAFDAEIKNTETFETEYRLIHPNTGAVVWVCTTGVVIADAHGLPVRLVGVTQNITPRKQAEEKLRVSEERLSLAIAGANIGTFDWNIKTGAIEWSSELEETAAIKADEFGNSFEGVMKIIHPEDRERVQNCIGTALTDGDYECEFRMIRGDGTIRWVIGKGKVTFDADGTPARLVGVDIDITKRKLAEDELRENQLFTASIIETAPSVIYLFDLDTKRPTYLTRQAAELIGYSFDEVKGDQGSFMEKFMHPDDTRRAQTHFQKLQQTHNGEMFEFEYRMQHKSGEWRWFRSRDRIFKRDENGKPAEILGVAFDITERKQAVEELRESQEVLSLAMQSSRMGAWSRDLATETVYWSAELEELFGLEAGTFAGNINGFWDYVYVEDKERIEREIQTALIEHREYIIEFRFHHADGTLRWMEGRGQAVYAADGTPVKMYGIGIDITDRKQAEEELKASEEFNRTVLESSPDCVKILDGEGRLQYMNVNGMCLLEIDDFTPCRNEFWWNLWQEESQPLVKDAVKKARRGETVKFEIHSSTVKGTPKWWDIIVSPISGVDGKPPQLISVSRDITERKYRELNLAFLADMQKDFAPLSSAEAIMNVVSERLAEYLNVSRCNFIEINETADIAKVVYDYHTPDLSSLIGDYKLSEFYTEEERRTLAAETPLVINDVRDESRTAEAAANFAALGIRALANAPYLTKGQWKFSIAVQNNQPRQWRTDEIELLGELSARIYTRLERARAEEKLRESEERFRALFNSIDEGFCIIEMIFDENDKPVDYRFEQINPAFSRLTGLPESAVGKTMLEFEPDLENFWFETYGKVVLTGEPARFENEAVSMNRWFDVFASRIGNGNSRRVAVVFNNITDRKTAELEREKLLIREQELRREAEDTNRAKDEFLAILSHELRTPLNSIFGWTQILEAGDYDREKTKRGIEIIARNVRLQNALIEDLLDVSRIISGKMKLESAVLPLISVAQGAVDEIRPVAEQRSIKIETNLDANIGEINGDKFRLQQIFGNILTNAVKFTPENSTIFVSLNSDGETAKFTVKDSGIGIAKELLPHVFDRFRQADGSAKRQFGGLGLGLTIVKNLVELHGGTVSAFSDGENQGATFVVELPLRPHFDSPLPKNFSAVETNAGNINLNDGKILSGSRILVVDDDDSALGLIQFVLEDKGADITCAKSAKEALQKLETGEYDLLISDLGMPGMDGYDLIRAVRQSESVRVREIPAIALSGYVSAEDRENVMLAGFQTHLPKPVDIDHLSITVLNLLQT